MVVSVDWCTVLLGVSEVTSPGDMREIEHGHLGVKMDWTNYNYPRGEGGGRGMD